MRIHILKTDPEIYDDERAGIKPFMFRVNDRGFEVGDIVVSRKTAYTGDDMCENGAPLVFTGDVMLAEITYIFEGPFYTLPAGSVIMGYRPLESGDEVLP